MSLDRLIDVGKRVADTASIGTAVVTLIGWMPKISAVLSVLWLAIRIWESATVQKVIGRIRGLLS